ncbi:MAG: PilT/PilU family type 4a pilus ATPase [Desulfobulbaceae bacterium]|nr:PilT/PilU family type 4a pilus ATPase [Desulfobulbaceae bacterium]
MAVLDKVFKAAVDLKASDVHVVPGEPFMIRHCSRLIKSNSQALTPEQSSKMIEEILTAEQRQLLRENLQLDFALEIEGLGRFRGSVMLHNNGISGVFRIIPVRIPTLTELGMPEIVFRSLDHHQGLILVTGGTGHGKSTTLAAMVDHINTNRAQHVLTIEDPIEFVHPLKKAVVNQRQRNRDTLSYGNALKGALRQDPDVIIIGELRDMETTALAISASETGHLVIATLATSSAPKTIDRVLDSFPPGEQGQIRAMLSESLKLVLTQRLIPNVGGTNREMALEILVGNLSVANLIRDCKTFQLGSVLQMGKSQGMRIMDESILELLDAGKISLDNALANANNHNLFAKHISQDKANKTGQPSPA